LKIQNIPRSRIVEETLGNLCSGFGIGIGDVAAVVGILVAACVMGSVILDIATRDASEGCADCITDCFEVGRLPDPVQSDDGRLGVGSSNGRG